MDYISEADFDALTDLLARRRKAVARLATIKSSVHFQSAPLAKRLEMLNAQQLKINLLTDQISFIKL